MSLRSLVRRDLYHEGVERNQKAHPKLCPIEFWFADNLLHEIHVWYVSNVPAATPVYRIFIPTAPTGGFYAAPAWIMTSIDGKYLYPETMEVISTATHQVIGQLLDETGGRMSSRYSVEIDFSNAVPIPLATNLVLGDRRFPQRIQSCSLPKFKSDGAIARARMKNA